MRDLLHTVDSASMVERVDRRREAAVHAKDAVLHQRSHREVVEQVREVFPHVRVAIFAQALVIETVHLRNLSALVVATGESDAPRVANLKCDQERHTLEGVVTTIDVVTHEQIVCVRGLAADAEELHQVEELAMDITANSDRRLYLGYIRLGGKKLLRFLTQLADALLQHSSSRSERCAACGGRAVLARLEVCSLLLARAELGLGRPLACAREPCQSQLKLTSTIYNS